jgi:ectoine hydroxylase-related dioxygenase (phytanoyl-CoA dioxygenase family)
MTLHGSGSNTSNTTRTAIVVHFIPENSPYIKNSCCDNHFNVEALKERNPKATVFENLPLLWE